MSQHRARISIRCGDESRYCSTVSTSSPGSLSPVTCSASASPTAAAVAAAPAAFPGRLQVPVPQRCLNLGHGLLKALKGFLPFGHQLPHGAHARGGPSRRKFSGLTGPRSVQPAFGMGRAARPTSSADLLMLPLVPACPGEARKTRLAMNQVARRLGPIN